MTIECRVCGEPKEVRCTPEQYQAWVNGKLIQAAMPDTPAAERELLVSGLCGGCFERMFHGETQ